MHNNDCFYLFKRNLAPIPSTRCVLWHYIGGKTNPTRFLHLCRNCAAHSWLNETSRLKYKKKEAWRICVSDFARETLASSKTVSVSLLSPFFICCNYLPRLQRNLFLIDFCYILLQKSFRCKINVSGRAETVRRKKRESLFFLPVKFVTILLGGLACFFCLPVSDLLPHRPAVQRISTPGAAALDVWPASNHLL